MGVENRRARSCTADSLSLSSLALSEMRLRARARGPNENERRAVKARSRRDCAHPSRPQERRENEREKQSHADCTTRIYTRSLAGCTPEISPERGVSFFFSFYVNSFFLRRYKGEVSLRFRAGRSCGVGFN